MRLLRLALLALLLGAGLLLGTSAPAMATSEAKCAYVYPEPEVNPESCASTGGRSAGSGAASY